jgi:hemolysin III
MHEPRRSYEETANAITHGVGLLASVAGAAVLVPLAALGGDARQAAGAAVFCASLVLLYLASTLYHAAWRRGTRPRLLALDHCAIYVLIAGTYTPFTLVSLRGGSGEALLGAVWSLAAAGVAVKLFWAGRFELLSTLVYLGMGWLFLVDARGVLAALPGWGGAWLLAGGLAYTAGTFFFLSRRVPYGHAVWHLFVLAGSACHFVAVSSQVLPGGLSA